MDNTEIITEVTIVNNNLKKDEWIVQTTIDGIAKEINVGIKIFAITSLTNLKGGKFIRDFIKKRRTICTIMYTIM